MLDSLYDNLGKRLPELLIDKIIIFLHDKDPNIRKLFFTSLINKICSDLTQA